MIVKDLIEELSKIDAIIPDMEVIVYWDSSRRGAINNDNFKQSKRLIIRNIQEENFVEISCED